MSLQSGNRGFTKKNIPEEDSARHIDYIVSFWELELACVRACIQHHVTEEDGDTGSDDSPTQWTDPEVYLVELAYAVYWAGSINRGNTTRKAIMNKLGEAFGVDLKDGYRTYSDVSIRKDRTKYLDILKNALERGLEDNDKKRSAVNERNKTRKK